MEADKRRPPSDCAHATWMWQKPASVVPGGAWERRCTGCGKLVPADTPAPDTP